MRSMTRFLFLLGIVALVGCEQEPTDPVPADPAVKSMMTLKEDSTHFRLLESLDYELIQGSVTPGEGGLVYGESKTWPKGCFFGLDIPSGALDTSDPSPVHFEIRVPTYDSYMEYAHMNLPLIMRFEPDGIEFHDSVTVIATWMPWDKGTPEKYWNVAHVIEGGVVVDVEYRDIGDIRRTAGDEDGRIYFKVNHFSDWETGGIPD